MKEGGRSQRISGVGEWGWGGGSGGGLLRTTAEVRPPSPLVQSRGNLMWELGMDVG